MSKARWVSMLVALPVLATGGYFVIQLWETSRDRLGGVEEYEPHARLFVRRMLDERQTAPVGGSIRASDRLSFAYTNRTGKRYLIVFGLDEHKNIQWFHPVRDPSRPDPVSITITTTDTPVALPGARPPEVEGKSLRIFGVFTDRPLEIGRIEALVKQQRGPIELLPIRGAIQQASDLAIRP